MRIGVGRWAIGIALASFAGACGDEGSGMEEGVAAAAGATSSEPDGGPMAPSSGSAASVAGSGGSAGRTAGTGGLGGAGSSTNAGSTAPTLDAGPAGGSSSDPPDADCFQAVLLWSDDFEDSDYSAWSSHSYGADWGNECQDTARSTETAVSGVQSQRSEITCAYTAEGGVHRGYGGMQFSGDEPLDAHTLTGVGIDAPYGIVNTLWVRLDSPTVFENGTWVSFFTSTSECDWTGQVLTFGIEDASDRLAAAHYQINAGGTREFEPDAPGLPRGQWARLTTYVSYHDGVMHVWQDGQSQQHVTFDRPLPTICHFHWGLYASGDNTDIVLFEDDNSIWKLEAPWTDWSTEPYFGQDVAVCD